MQEYSVRVKPGSKKGPLVEAGESGRLTVYVRERAVDCEANQAVMDLLAQHFGVSKSRVLIVRGQSSRAKLVKIL